MNQQRATIIINRTPEEARQQRDDFMRRHGGKSAFDVMMDDIARRNLFIQRQCLNFGNFKIPTAQHLFYLSNTVASSKAIKQQSELLAELIGFLFLNTYQFRLNSGAINRILFSHFSRDNTSQIDSTAQNV